MRGSQPRGLRTHRHRLFVEAGIGPPETGQTVRFAQGASRRRPPSPLSRTLICDSTSPENRASTPTRIATASGDVGARKRSGARALRVALLGAVHLDREAWPDVA